MKLTAVSKIKNGLLWEAVKKMGSQAELARHLEVRAGELGKWTRMKHIPQLSRCRKLNPEKWDKIENKLFVLTGAILEEIFPQQLRRSKFLEHPKTFEVQMDVPMERLIDAPKEFLMLPPIQEEIIVNQERDQAIDEVLKNLTERERSVIRSRFGLDEAEKTLDSIGHDWAVSKVRIRQIEAKALQKLRYPSNSRRLRPFIDPDFYDNKRKREKESD